MDCRSISDNLQFLKTSIAGLRQLLTDFQDLKVPACFSPLNLHACFSAPLEVIQGNHMEPGLKLQRYTRDLPAIGMHAFIVHYHGAINIEAAAIVSLEPEDYLLHPLGLPAPQKKEAQVIMGPEAEPSALYSFPAVRGIRISSVVMSISAILLHMGVRDRTSVS